MRFVGMKLLAWWLMLLFSAVVSLLNSWRSPIFCAFSRAFCNEPAGRSSSSLCHCVGKSRFAFEVFHPSAAAEKIGYCENRTIVFAPYAELPPQPSICFHSISWLLKAVMDLRSLITQLHQRNLVSGVQLFIFQLYYFKSIFVWRYQFGEESCHTDSIKLFNFKANNESVLNSTKRYT